MNTTGFLEVPFTSAKSYVENWGGEMRIAEDLSIFLEHPSLLLLLAFLVVILKELLKALGF